MLVTKREVNGWILARFFFCVIIDWDKVKVNKKTKKSPGQCPAILTEQAWSIKGSLYGQKENLFIICAFFPFKHFSVTVHFAFHGQKYFAL